MGAWIAAPGRQAALLSTAENPGRSIGLLAYWCCRANRRCGLIQAVLSSISAGRVLRSPAVEFCEWTAPPRASIMAYHTAMRHQSAPCFRLGNRFGLLLLSRRRAFGATHGLSTMSMKADA